jgi:diaminopimelate decarboxylase
VTLVAEGAERGGAAQPDEGPIARHLLPETAEVASDGRLAVGGCDLEDLADRFGTPLFVYDETELRSRCREALAAFGEGVAYATKAFLCREMARLATEEGLSLDVSTGGELAVALAAGVPADRLVMHGNNKSVEELRRALEVGVGRLVVDSFDELDRLEAMLNEAMRNEATLSGASRRARPRGMDPSRRPIPVLVRVTPGIEAHTHEFVRTGQEDSKFGFGLASGAAARAIERVRSLAGAALVGVHVHIGSQIFDAQFFAAAVDAVAGLVRAYGLAELCIGGGLGVAYLGTERAPTITEWAEVVHRACRQAGLDRSVRVTAEPGRAIVARAGITLYRVGTVKAVDGVRTYVAVDGGMSDNPRPVLYGSGYEAFLPRAASAPRPRRVTVVGKHCESGDVLVADARVPEDLRIGDVLATPVTGAYGYAMASNYNMVPRPAVVFVRDGEARVVRRRESEEDLLRLDG